MQVRLERLRLGNPGDVKSVGDGVVEMRIDFGPGIRLYYVQIGTASFLMLGGGDKSSQERDIKRARSLAARLKEN